MHNKKVQWGVYFGIMLGLVLFGYWLIHSVTVSEKMLFCVIVVMLCMIYLIWSILFSHTRDIANSRIIKYIRKHGLMIALLLFIAAICTFISYPGMWYSDSYARVELGFSLKKIIRDVISGKASVYSGPFTPTPSLYMAICMLFTDNIAFYTMMQAFFLFAGIAIFIDRVFSDAVGKWVGILLLMTSPVVYCAATYYEAGIGCLVGMLFLISALSANNFDNSFDRYLQWIVIAISTITVFGYRINAFTVIPVLLLMIWKLYRKYTHALCMIAALAVGLFFVIMLPKWTDITVTMNSAEGFAWELVTAIQMMPEDKQEKYITYLDDIAGDGATANSVKVNTSDNICAVIFGAGTVTRDVLQKPGAADKVLRKYVSFALNNKRQYLKMKWFFISSMMGIEKPLNLWEWDYNRYDNMEKYQYNDSELRELYYSAYDGVINHSGILLRPWIMFLISAILLFVYRRSAVRWYAFLVAMFYYGGFLINTQSMEFRYFYPSCIILIIIILASVFDMLSNIYQWVMRKRKASGNKL